MQKPKQSNPQVLEEPLPTKWLDYILDDRLKLAIPVGPRFQADIPKWTGAPRVKEDRLKLVIPVGLRFQANIQHWTGAHHSSDSGSNTSKWLGTRVWPSKYTSPDTIGGFVGKGRPGFCQCLSPGSIECVKHHVSEKRIQLQFDLGPAFKIWKFDEMGQDVSKLWSLEEQKKFDSLVKTNPISQAKSFLKPAVESLPSHCKETIVSYYLNVYIPRRMSIQTRAGFQNVDTDDDEFGETPNSNSSRKRYRADIVTSSSSKYARTRYLTGRR